MDKSRLAVEASAICSKLFPWGYVLPSSAEEIITSALIRAREEGFKRGVEEAAKVAESRQFHSDYQYDIGTCDRIANEIKKLKRS